ncbi:zymogen granule protein 16 homolog B [Lepus europaeus]|uniref:zymogen granule protein 16 homolog B n=1 Tax=Lepus europaeus TaxID=9983 RepID=UPI002B45EA7B|nr:zymogen granule protein 16 homolog B [Lepus europaeus]
MLLLLLGLTLLGTPASWAQTMYGLKGERFFSTYADEDNEVRAVRITTNLLGQIQSIQVKIGCVWDAVYGTAGWKTQELILQPGEHITAIHGQHLLKIWTLTLCTNHSRCVEFGKKAGKPFSAFPDQDGEVLKGVFGLLASSGFKGMGFQWGLLPAESLPGPACNSTL